MSKSKIKQKKIAIIADWLTSRGGAEHVVEALAELFPKATIFTSVYNPELFPLFKGRKVRTTFLQSLPTKLRHKHQFLLPLLPRAFEKLDVSDFDLLISSSAAFSKCIRKDFPSQKHICYCHSPTRYLYHAREEYLRDYSLPLLFKPLRPFLRPVLNFIERRDRYAALQVDHFLSNSEYIAQRIERYYGRPATTIYPGVGTAPFVEAWEHQKEKGRDDYFLAVGRFIPYKKFELLIRTFAKNKLPLKLVGQGPEWKHCKHLAKQLDAQNIDFLGFVDREALPELYAKARAFLFPAEEDFGLTPIEALSSGCPVIYYNHGGAVESVGEYGWSFDEQTVSALQAVITKFIETASPKKEADLIKRGQAFDTGVFQQNFLHFVEEVCGR